MAAGKAAKTGTKKVITGPVPANYADLPEAERMEIADRLAGQLQAGLGRGPGGQVLGWPRLGRSRP